MGVCERTSSLCLIFPFVSAREGGWEGDFQGWRVIDPRMQGANILKQPGEPLKLIGTICVVSRNEGHRELESRDNICSVLRHGTDASVPPDFTAFSWLVWVKEAD